MQSLLLALYNHQIVIALCLTTNQPFVYLADAPTLPILTILSPIPFKSPDNTAIWIIIRELGRHQQHKLSLAITTTKANHQPPTTTRRDDHDDAATNKSVSQSVERPSSPTFPQLYRIIIVGVSLVHQRSDLLCYIIIFTLQFPPLRELHSCLN